MITVNPVISENVVAVTAVIDSVSVSASVSEREIEAASELSNSIVSVTADLSGSITADAQLFTRLKHGDYNEYQGAYEFTPTTEAQTIPTDHLVLMDNITIDPIPNNYGLITWDGSTLMVS